MLPNVVLKKISGVRSAVWTVALALLVALVVVGLLASGAYAAPSTFTVNSTADPGTGGCDATECTLREALDAANANNNPTETDLIQFNIPGAGVHTIKPTVILPGILDPVIIDGYTQPGAQVNTLAKGTNAKLLIRLDGTLVHDVLRIHGGGTTIRGLVINNAGPNDPGQGVGILLPGNVGNTANVIEGNFIGTTAQGTAAKPNNGPGVQILDGSTGNTIGGTTPAARNLISANGNLNSVNVGFGISVRSDSNTISGNLIGTDKSATMDLGNRGHGVEIAGGDNNTISGNTIAFNYKDGVTIRVVTGGPATVNNRLSRNSIFFNDGQGIDLGDNGPTPNDRGDTDSGPNNLQNFPEIFAASTSATGQTTVRGQLDSTANQSYTLQFFSNPPDSGEGKTFVAQRTLPASVSDLVEFSFTLNNTIPVGQSITATATDASGNTSEFSEPRLVRRP